MSTTKPKKLAPTLVEPQEMIAIMVGKDAKKFTAHKGFICHYSSFFKAAFDGDFEEAKAGTLKLDDVDPEIFGVLLHWIYTQKIDVDHGQIPTSAVLGRLLILADRLLVPKLQNELLNHLEYRRVDNHDPIPVSEYHHLYANTSDGSPLRRYVVAVHAIDKTGSANRKLISDSDLYPRQMLADLVNYLATPEYLESSRFSAKDLADFKVKVEGEGIYHEGISEDARTMYAFLRTAKEGSRGYNTKMIKAQLKKGDEQVAKAEEQLVTAGFVDSSFVGFLSVMDY